MKTEPRSETRDRTISGLLALAVEYDEAGMEVEMLTLLAACQLLQRARDEEEDEGEGE